MRNSKVVGLTFNGSLKKAGVTFFFLFSFFFVWCIRKKFVF